MQDRKLQDMKMPDMKMQDMKMTDKNDGRARCCRRTNRVLTVCKFLNPKHRNTLCNAYGFIPACRDRPKFGFGFGFGRIFIYDIRLRFGFGRNGFVVSAYCRRLPKVHTAVTRVVQNRPIKLCKHPKLNTW